ncbi:MAG: hypothetical protein R6V40_01650 [Candidatus Moraniibacteriota bacterium]
MTLLFVIAFLGYFQVQWVSADYNLWKDGNCTNMCNLCTKEPLEPGESVYNVDSAYICNGTGDKEVCSNSENYPYETHYRECVACNGPSYCGYRACKSGLMSSWYPVGDKCVYQCEVSSNCGDTSKLPYGTGYLYCDIEGDVNKICRNGNVWGEYDRLLWEYYDYYTYRISDTWEGGPHTHFYDNNVCGDEVLEECGSDYCDSWGDWTCQDDNTKERIRTCYNQGCSEGSCYSEGYTDTETSNCPSDQECISGSCQCVSHDEKKCYNGKVYWYDSCGDREEEFNNCGSSYCDTSGNEYYYCSGDMVMGAYDYYNQGCSSGSCYGSWNYNSCGIFMKEDCSAKPTNCGYGSCDDDERPSWGCSGGDCEYSCSYDSNCDTCDPQSCSDLGHECGTHDDGCGGTVSCGSCGSSYCDTSGDVDRYCSGGNAWGRYDYLNRGCSSGDCYSNWDYNSCGHEMLDECTGGEECVNGYCECISHAEKRCAYGDVYWYDSCGNRENKAEDCGFNYCDTGGDVYEYCVGDSVYGVYDYANRGCSGGSCYTNWNYNSCENHFIENCGSDYCDSWGPWTCQDGDTKIRERTCYHQGCSSGSCYKTPYTETDTQDCVKDGVIQDDLPGKCIQGQCVYSGQCGSAVEEDSSFCEKPDSNLCFIDFFENPTIQYDEAGGDKSQDEFYWTCDGYDPDSTADDAECKVERDCQVVPDNWQED